MHRRRFLFYMMQKIISLHQLALNAAFLIERLLRLIRSFTLKIFHEDNLWFTMKDETTDAHLELKSCLAAIKIRSFVSKWAQMTCWWKELLANHEEWAHARTLQAGSLHAGWFDFQRRGQSEEAQGNWRTSWTFDKELFWSVMKHD